ncbi:MAG: hypothetical protein IGR76_14880 [Synechococcales cyanobacterium T60_A2020_003]|nr:hypothetical protein [Synechococcales cyanobacterium T60_A2020_003]
MHHTYAPNLSPVSPPLFENSNAIRELQTQLSQEKFVEKLVKFAKPATSSNASVPTNTAHLTFHTLKKTGVPAAGICFALSSIAASPLGNQSNLNPLTDWVSDRAPEHVHQAVLQQIDSFQEATQVDASATDHGAIAPSSAALDLKQMPSPQPAFFMDTLGFVA